ncbi:MAG: sodium:solute symporter family protein [Planctomycetales bacterium]|nr:sodium:solute symporter family protein [Planctomycetales bacterium]
MGIHWIDLTVLILYLLGITVLGVWMSRRVKTMGDYFMPRRFGSMTMIMHSFGTGTASDQAVTVASGTAQNGISGIWYQWLWLIPTPFYWLVAPIMRRFRAVTTADVLTLRFDMSVAVLFSIVGIVSMSVKIGAILKGAAAVVDSGTGGLLDSTMAIAAITILFLIYGIAGGLSAAIVTDFVQGILTIVFSFILLPFVFSAVGGMAGIRETITDPNLLSLATPKKISTFFVIMLGIQGLVGIVAQPHVMGVCGAGKTEKEGRIGFMVGNLVKRLCTVAWCLTGIAAVAWYLNQGLELDQIRNKEFADKIYGDMANTFLPRISPGLLGIFLASLLAAVMSSCDSFMISSAGLFSENIYKPLFPNKSIGHYLMVSRVTSVAVVAGGVCFAIFVPNVVEALEIWFKISPMSGIAFWMCLFWRRMTVAGAWATTVTGFATWWLSTLPRFVSFAAGLPGARPLGFIWEEGGKQSIHEPWKILFYMACATIAGIVVSFLTCPVDKQKLDRFHELIRTPVQPGEVIEEPCTLPPGVTVPDRKMLINCCGIEVPAPSATSVWGFSAGTLAGVVLVVLFWWFAKSG